MSATGISFQNRSRRSGVTLIYAVFMMTAMCGFASLAFDYGHVQMCKNQMRRCVDAAARAAAGGLNSGPAAAQALALQYATLNKVDGSALLLDPSQGDIQFGKWVIDPSGKTPSYFQVLSGAAASGANAVRVSGHRTSARGTAVPLVFGPGAWRTFLRCDCGFDCDVCSCHQHQSDCAGDRESVSFGHARGQ